MAEDKTLDKLTELYLKVKEKREDVFLTTIILEYHSLLEDTKLPPEQIYKAMEGFYLKSYDR